MNLKKVKIPKLDFEGTSWSTGTDTVTIVVSPCKDTTTTKYRIDTQSDCAVLTK